MKLIKSTVLFSLLLSLPAWAGTDMITKPDSKDMKGMSSSALRTDDGGYYVAVEGGAQFSTSYGDSHQTASFPDGSLQTANRPIHSFWGGVGGIRAGYNFSSFAYGDMPMGLRLQPAVEAEALYIGMDDSHAAGTFQGGTTQFSSNSGDFFLNGILRLKNSSKLTPYFGLGVGLQYITTHGQVNIPEGPVTGLDTSDLDFAGQALAGFDYLICPHISLFTEYKFIDALGTDAKASLPDGGTYRLKADQIEQNLVTAGLKYSF